MNYKLITHILGWILRFEALFMLAPALVGVCYREYRQSIIFLIVAAVCLLLGYPASRLGSGKGRFYTREGLVTVALGWIIMSVFGALPFVLTGDIPCFTDALFETISGFTTTGASILSDVESLSRSCLFWRSFTHWVGGMGVFVFIMAILPMLGGSTMNIMRAESTGPSVGKLVPRVKDTAKILYSIYIAITLIEIVILLICGMPLFDSLTLSFGTTGTGGFGILNSSIGSYKPVVQYVITVFMILSGVNYTAFFCLLRRQLKEAFSIEEVRWYIGIILLSALLIAGNIYRIYGSVEASMRHAFFQVASVITTTGYSTVDYDMWPTFSKTILIILMFLGACAGSTGGGIKISRIMILLKSITKELSLMVHPRIVNKIKIDKRVVSLEVVRSTNVFLTVYCMMFLGSLLLISIDNFDFTTNFTAVLATLNNIGPGLELVGPSQNFGLFSAFSKYVLIFDMLAGRLELFPLLILFHRDCWKKY